MADQLALMDAMLTTMKTVADRLSARIDALEKREPIHGRDGLPGRDGASGKDGRDGVDGKDGAAGLNGKDGADGLHGKDGQDGINGKDGAPGLNGKDGSDGLNGKDGSHGMNGKDGADGLGFEDMDVVVDDDGVFVAFKRGEVSKRWRLPVPVYRDVYAYGKTYEPGDMVTWDGSCWIAKAATSEKPGLSTAASRAWKLCVKRGNEGKPGTDGKQGPQGPQGELRVVEKW